MARFASPATSIEYTLLGLLSHQPCHGYELHKQLSQLCGVGLVWRIKQPHLYALLDKLERKGWVEEMPAVEDPHPTRKQFGLTQEGEQAFITWLYSPAHRARNMRQDFLARLYFARLISDSLVKSLIQQQGLVCQSWLHSLERQLSADDNPTDFQTIVCHFRIEQVRGLIKWLDWVWEAYSVRKETL